MTAVEYLFTHLFPYLDFSKTEDRIKIRQFEQNALNMEKQQIIDAVLFGMQKELNVNKVPETDGDCVNNYYTSTYGSKGSDEFCTPKGKIKRYVDCIGCDRKASSQTEISDEEIKEFTSNKSIFVDDIPRAFFILGAKWYRQQLKNIK